MKPPVMHQFELGGGSWLNFYFEWQKTRDSSMTHDQFSKIERKNNVRIADGDNLLMFPDGAVSRGMTQTPALRIQIVKSHVTLGDLTLPSEKSLRMLQKFIT
jgi:hypothetical protein